jgi:hypothetical protein
LMPGVPSTPTDDTKETTMTSTVQNTTLSQGEVRLRWTAPLPPHPLDAEPRSRDTRVEVFPCGSDLEQEVIADMVESGEWDFDGPIPHWHDTRPVCLKVTTERQVQLWRLEDGPRGGSLYRARLVTRGTVVSVRGDSPEFRAQALRMADGLCELGIRWPACTFISMSRRRGSWRTADTRCTTRTARTGSRAPTWARWRSGAPGRWRRGTGPRRSCRRRRRRPCR